MIKVLLAGLLLAVVNASSAYVLPPLDVARIARTIVNQSSWASVATISSDSNNPGFPMVNLLSTADGKVGAASTGEIFFYMMAADTVAKDVEQNNKISFMFTEAQGGECKKRGDDPWSHKCARVIISGKVKKLEKGSKEYARGLEAFVSRHPTAANWENIPNHVFYLCKLDITDVMMFSRGYMYTSPQNYFIGTDFNNKNEV